jgi:uncharacterized protein
MSADLYTALLAIAGIAAGCIAAISGFGIGSLLTPVLAFTMDTRLAIAAVSVPRLIGTAQRFWTLRRNIDRRLLLEFGLTSAAGGLIGALMHGRRNGNDGRADCRWSQDAGLPRDTRS